MCQVEKPRPYLMNLPKEFGNTKPCARVSYPSMNEIKTRVRCIMQCTLG